MTKNLFVKIMQVCALLFLVAFIIVRVWFEYDEAASKDRPKRTYEYFLNREIQRHEHPPTQQQLIDDREEDKDLTYEESLDRNIAKMNVMMGRYRSNCTLSFTVNGATISEIIPKPVDTVRVVIEVNDPDAADVISRVELFEDGNVVQTKEPNSPHVYLEMIRKPQAGKHFYFAKVTQKNGNELWSKHVWVTVK